MIMYDVSFQIYPRYTQKSEFIAVYYIFFAMKY